MISVKIKKQQPVYKTNDEHSAHEVSLCSNIINSHRPLTLWFLWVKVFNGQAQRTHANITVTQRHPVAQRIHHNLNTATKGKKILMDQSDLRCCAILHQ